MDSDLAALVSGSLDLYKFMDVEPTASVNEIRSRYRRLALLYHPDKNNGDGSKFTLLLQIFHVLSTTTLRQQYDDIRRLTSELSSGISSDLQASIDRFRSELARDELLAQKKSTPTIDVEQLSKEGLELRRKNENLLRPKATNNYISFDQLNIPRVFSFENSHTVHVTWKHRDELVDLFNADVLREIMLIFGPIVSAKVFRSLGSRYDSGTVEYEHATDAEKALLHDYKKSASLWDGTSVRKLASLLRKCSLVSDGDIWQVLERYEGK